MVLPACVNAREITRLTERRLSLTALVAILSIVAWSDLTTTIPAAIILATSQTSRLATMSNTTMDMAPGNSAREHFEQHLDHDLARNFTACCFVLAAAGCRHGLRQGTGFFSALRPPRDFDF
jgi:hypothetical protein